MQAYANARNAEHEVSLSNAWPSYYSNSYLNTAGQHSDVAIAKAMWYEYFPLYWGPAPSETGAVFLF